jgi:hypothetical protein
MVGLGPYIKWPLVWVNVNQTYTYKIKMLHIRFHKNLSKDRKKIVRINFNENQDLLTYTKNTVDQM